MLEDISRVWFKIRFDRSRKAGAAGDASLTLGRLRIGFGLVAWDERPPASPHLSHPPPPPAVAGEVVRDLRFEEAGASGSCAFAVKKIALKRACGYRRPVNGR